MTLTIYLTILAVVFGCVGLVLPWLVAPVLAVFLIYFIWKTYNFNETLEEIKKLLQAQCEEKAAAESENPQPNTDTEDSES